jgi:hypothetical protein
MAGKGKEEEKEEEEEEEEGWGGRQKFLLSDYPSAHLDSSQNIF